MWPRPRAIIFGRKTWFECTTEKRFRSTIRRHSAVGISSGLPLRMTPTLFITMSISPRLRSASAATSPTEASRVTSQPKAAASPPAALIAAAVSWAPARLISATATLPPRRANSCATAWPMPCPPP